MVKDFDAADGRLRWQVGLPSENGGYQVLCSRPRFAPDGKTAYFGTFVSAPNSPDQYANLYAVDISAAGVSTSALRSVAVAPGQVVGGSPAAGTVELTTGAPSGGAVVKLKSSSSKTASVPKTVIVPEGAASAAFTVTTRHFSRTRTATILATYAGVKKKVVLAVTP